MSHSQRAREVLDIEIDGLAEVRDGLRQEFDKAAGCLLDCLAAGGKIVVSGVGKNLHVAQKISAEYPLGYCHTPGPLHTFEYQT